jgi:hypothetical protein
MIKCTHDRYVHDLKSYVCTRTLQEFQEWQAFLAEGYLPFKVLLMKAYSSGDVM